MINKAFKLFNQKFSEAWTACIVAMTQGDLTVVSLKHAMIASKTGLLTGLAVVATYVMCKQDHKWLNIWLTGLFVALADFITHPTHYGSQWTEAAVTGLGAAMLAFMVESFWKKR